MATHIREIEAKTLLGTVKAPEHWFGVRYNLNIYRGCEHRCVYCDSRSECYQIDDFDGEVLVKVNALERLEAELPRKRHKAPVGTGAMSDPYTHAERRYNLTGRALELLARYRFPAHISTKSDLILKDLETLRVINTQTHATVAFTVTTADDALAEKLEPGAPRPSARFAALAQLAAAGILTGVLLMPVLPYLEDNTENITAIVRQAATAGARFIIPGFGVTLRDRQRAYYYAQLDRLFPGLRAKYEQRFGDRYSCGSDEARALRPLFNDLCRQHRLATDMRLFAAPPPQKQLSLW